MSIDALRRKFTWDSRFDAWDGRIDLPWWGETFEVNVDLQFSEDKSGHAAFARLQKIIAYEGDLKSRFADAVFEMYTEHIYGSFEASDSDGNDITEQVAPKIHTTGEIWPLLKPPYRLYLNASKDSPVEFGMSMGAIFDDHGVGARIKDWQVARVGPASEGFL